MPIDNLIYCTCELCRVAGRNNSRREDLRRDQAITNLREDLRLYRDFVAGSLVVSAEAALESLNIDSMNRASQALREAYLGARRPPWPTAYDDDPYIDDDYGYDDDDTSSYGSDLIHYHDYRPRPVFFGDGPLYMGFELETAVSGYGGLDTAARLVMDRIGDHGYLKEDGSISHGFEIVTHPMSYDYAINRFPWEVLRDMRENGIGPDGSTGLHVHVSRKAFASPAHVYKWMKFIYRNQNAVEAVARRRSTGWAKFDNEHRRNILAYSKDTDGRYYGDRYSAINVQNEHTFEVRVFNSTVKRRELQAALGFVDASVRYAADIDSAAILNASAWEFPSFTKWAYTAEREGKSKASYSSLLTEIDRLELV